MGMTIEEAIKEGGPCTEITWESEWVDFAIDIMHKYQKIQEVMDSRPDDSAKSNSKALGEIEVIMYGNND